MKDVQAAGEASNPQKRTSSSWKQYGQWIRIQIRIRIQEGKNDPQKYEKIKKFHVLKCMFSLGAEDFFCGLDVIYAGLGIG
jgi:hypothetical protein